jgi:hypothetical protein
MDPGQPAASIGHSGVDVMELLKDIGL